jgi:hypothetical protein
MSSSVMLLRVVLMRTDISDEPSVSIIRVTRIGELGTYYFFAACAGCYLLLTFLARRFLLPSCQRRYVLPKRRFLKEPDSVTSQKTEFF